MWAQVRRGRRVITSESFLVAWAQRETSQLWNTHCLPESHSAVHPVGALVYPQGLTYGRLLGSDEDFRGGITAEAEVHPPSVAPTGSQGRLSVLTEDHIP